MQARLNFREASPGAMKTLDDMREYLRDCGLAERLRLCRRNPHLADQRLRALRRPARATGERDIVDLSLAIAAMNAWNRFGVGFRLQPPTRE